MRHELILTIINRGFADLVMDAAKAAGASGGTVVHARGTGVHEAEKFFGIIVQPEKELVLILTEREKKNDIMTAICKHADLKVAGNGICFALPVDQVMGLTGPLDLPEAGAAQAAEGAHGRAADEAEARTDGAPPDADGAGGGAPGGE